MLHHEYKSRVEITASRAGDAQMVKRIKFMLDTNEENIKNRLTNKLLLKYPNNKILVEDKANKKYEDFKSLSRSLIMTRLIDQIVMHVGETQDDESIDRLMKETKFKNKATVLFHLENREWPQTFLGQCLVTAMKGDISEKYVFSFFEFFDSINLAVRSNCASGPTNSLAIKFTDDFFKMVDSKYALIENMRIKYADESNKEPVTESNSAL